MDFTPEKWFTAGPDALDQVGKPTRVEMAMNWNEDLSAFEMTPVSPRQYQLDLDKWREYVAFTGGTLELFDGPRPTDLHYNDPKGAKPLIEYEDMGQQTWIRITGPQARNMYVGAYNARINAPNSLDYEHSTATLSGLMTRMVLSGDDGKWHAPAVPDFSAHDAMPEWEGSPSFANVWRSADWLHDAFHMNRITSGMDVVGADAKTGLYNSHPIVIPPAQVLALPMMGSHEAVDYLSNAKMPFDTVFLDLASGPTPDSFTQITDDSGMKIGMAGGLVMDAKSDGVRCVVPCGSVLWPRYDDPEDGFVGGERPEPGTPGLLADPGSHGLPSHAPIASILCGLVSPEWATPDDDVGLGIRFRVHETGDAEPLERLWTVQRKEGQLEVLYVGLEVVGGPPNAVAILAIPDLLSFTEYDLKTARERIIGWTSMAVIQMRTLATCMEFMESHNIEIAEAKLSRQVRRQAERKNRPIAKTVYIRHRKSLTPVVEPAEPGSANYSHTFEVMGHPRHFTKGPHVWCKTCRGTGKVDGPLLKSGEQNEIECEKCGGLGLNKEMLTPCFRRDQNGNLTCPHGCRKEWVPTFTKGSGPLVKKARKQT